MSMIDITKGFEKCEAFGKIVRTIDGGKSGMTTINEIEIDGHPIEFFNELSDQTDTAKYIMLHKNGEDTFYFMNGIYDIFWYLVKENLAVETVKEAEQIAMGAIFYLKEKSSAVIDYDFYMNLKVDDILNLYKDYDESRPVIDFSDLDFDM